MKKATAYVETVVNAVAICPYCGAEVDLLDVKEDDYAEFCDDVYEDPRVMIGNVVTCYECEEHSNEFEVGDVDLNNFKH